MGFLKNKQECDKCGELTNLSEYESDTGYRHYLCGKCRGYSSDKEYIDERNKLDKEMYRHFKKEQLRRK